MKSQLMRLEHHPDNGEGGKCEEVIDYLLSFTLRMAMDNNKRELLRRECRKILFYFLGLNSEVGDNLHVIRVSPTKQWEKIDLIVDVELLRNNYVEYHCILIETKYFSKLDNDLIGYIQTVKDFHYPISPNHKRIMHYWVFHCRCEKDEANYIKVFTKRLSNSK